MPDKGEVIAGEKSNMVLGSHLETDTDVEEKVRNADNRNIWHRLWDFFVKAPQGGAIDGITLMRMQDSDTLEKRLMDVWPPRSPRSTRSYFDSSPKTF